jgi:hypothetical protein
MKLPTADGLLQRFAPLMMHEAQGYKDDSATDDARALLRPVRDRLVALVPEMRDDPLGQAVAVPYRLTAEGARLYQAFAEDMRVAARVQEPSREFGECLQKMCSMWLALALLFHLIEGPAATGIPFMVTEAMKVELRARGVSDKQIAEMTPQQAWETLAAPGTPAGGPPQAVPFAVARRVDAMVRGFFIPHAEQFYDQLAGGNGLSQRRSVACAILRCPKDEIVLRDMARSCRAMRGERDAQIKTMQRFEVLGWLTRLDPHQGSTRPVWQRTPGLGERFAEELKREETARAAVTAAIKSGAGDTTR